MEIVDEYNNEHRENQPEITKDEVSIIINATVIHSDKIAVTKEPYEELLKDVDSIDSFLHGMTPGRKSGRIPRIEKVFQELTINYELIKA